MWLNIKPETDAALGLACAQVMIEEDLIDRDYVLQQTDMPMLVRKDNQRFLRHSDMKNGGRDNGVYIWDEKRNRAVLAPGCEGDGEGGRSMELGKLKPALSGNFEVDTGRRQYRGGLSPSTISWSISSTMSTARSSPSKPRASMPI